MTERALVAELVRRRGGVVALRQGDLVGRRRRRAGGGGLGDAEVVDVDLLLGRRG